MKTQQEIKQALEDGRLLVECSNTQSPMDWHLKFGVRHNYPGCGSGAFDWPFIASARNSEYLSKHLFARQRLFGPIKICYGLQSL